MKILLVKFRNIGDVLLSTPLIENLKYHYPQAQIDFALNAGCQDMIHLNPCIDKVFIYDRKKMKEKSFFKHIQQEMTFVKNIISHNYDMVINLTEGDRGAILALLSNAKMKLGFMPRKGLLKYLNFYDKIGDDKKQVHTVEKDLQFIQFLDKEVINKKVSIFWNQKDEEKINVFLKKNCIDTFVQVHPVSRWMFKCWDDERTAEVIDYIQSVKGIKVLITAAPDEKELARVNQIITLCKTNPYNLSGTLTLKEMSYLSSKAKLFFGADTAPMHIAAAVNTPVVALFGASEVLYWGPWDNKTMYSKFINMNGIQENGIHTALSDIDHTIYYENNIKKCQGMINIRIEDTLKVLSNNL